MSCSWLLKSKFLGFLERSLATAMGCFIGCFRVRDTAAAARHRPSVVSSDHSISISNDEPIKSSSRNRLSSLLLFEAEEKENCSPCKDENLVVTGSSMPDFDVQELQDEAKFLKACGTLSQTPAEIRKASKKLKVSMLHDDDSESSKFHSWLPNTSIQKLNLVAKPDQPSTPIKLREEWVNESSFSAHSPSSCRTGQDTGRNYSSSEGCEVGNSYASINIHDSVMSNSAASTVSPIPSVACVQSRNKSVRFNCQSDASSFPSRSSSSETNETSKQSGTMRDRDVSKRSPYPTPLKLTDEMQTPGTAYPGYMYSLEAGKNPRIRSQYVFPALNPVENFSQLKALTEQASNSDQQCSQLPETIEETDTEFHSSEMGLGGSSTGKELNVEASLSLSTWLKPKPTNQGGGDRQSTVSQGHVDFGKTPGDRPILGMVAAHWNEDEASRISPKWWDGNGIPNSTNKYKEDQKVSWHATPFEERLEKALSEDSFLSGRKHLEGTPTINFEENECDSAESELQPCSSHMKSLVSY